MSRLLVMCWLNYFILSYYNTSGWTTTNYVTSVFIFLLWRCDPTRVMASSFTKFLDHTQRRSTVGRTPPDEWSALRRDLYLTTHNTQNRQTSMPLAGIRTHDLSRRATAYLCLRPRGHWDRQLVGIFFSVALRPNAGHGLLILEVSRSHTTTHHSR